MSEDDIERMERLQEKIEANTDVGRFLLLDREFHMASWL
jgi:DNA-binding GntR family transcriptional regulator